MNSHTRYPDGMLNDDDDGVMPMAVGVEKGNVCIAFPEPAMWIGLGPQQALALAQILIFHAHEAAAQRGMDLSSDEVH